MSIPTISEEIFEKFCAEKGVGCTRIPQSTGQTADYTVSLSSVTLITEVKQLGPNAEDNKLSEVWGGPGSPMAFS